MQQEPCFSPITPQTSQQLLQHLSNCISPDAALRSEALQWVEACQPKRGFQLCLLEVVAAHDLPLQVRHQSVLIFKNSIDKHWRRGVRDVIDGESKQHIRARLLTLVNEPDTSIAKALALCIGKLARLDYDREWPNLFTDLLGSMQQALQSLEHGHAQGRLVLQRCLLFFHQSIKALSQNRTLAGKNIIGRLCEDAFPVLLGLYRTIFSTAINSLQATHALPAPSAQPQDLELSLLTFKCLGKLVVYGWGGSGLDPAKKASVIEEQTAFFTSSMNDFVSLFQIRREILSRSENSAALASHGSGAHSPLIILNKHTGAYTKMYSAMLHQNHIHFHGLGQSRNLIQLHWSFVQEASHGLKNADLDSPASFLPLKLFMQALLLVKQCFTQFPYADSSLKDDAFAKECVDCIILRLLPMRQPDLDKWEADPEEWVKEEEEEKWKFDIRPCAEAFLRELMKQYERVLVQINAYRLQYETATAFDDVLIKEAIFAALSHCGNEFASAKAPDGSALVVFAQWLHDRLIPDGLSTDPRGIIIRRRVAAIAGNWISEDPSLGTQTNVYGLLSHLLKKNGSTDLAVRVTAAKGMASSDSWEMGDEAFLPYLESTLVELANILQEVELPETKMRLNEILGDIVIRAGANIKPHLGRLMEIIPILWSSADDDFSKQAIVATFKKLVDALGVDSQVLHPAIRDFVQGCCDPDSPSHVVLQDDGLELWKATLRLSTSASPEMTALAPLSVKLMTHGSDILPKVLRIVESYTLLDPATYLSNHIYNLFQNLGHLLSTLNEKAVKPILYTLDLVIQSVPAQLWAPALESSKTFLFFMQTIASNTSEIPIPRFLPTLARLAMCDLPLFTQLLAMAASQLQMHHDDLTRKLLAQWLDRYDNLSYPAQRKLVALGLSSFVQTTNFVVLDRIDEIITVWLSALSETEESSTGECVSPSYSGTGRGAHRASPASPHSLLQHAHIDALDFEETAPPEPQYSPTQSLSSRELSQSLLSQDSATDQASVSTGRTSACESLANDWPDCDDTAKFDEDDDDGWGGASRIAGSKEDISRWPTAGPDMSDWGSHTDTGFSPISNSAKWQNSANITPRANENVSKFGVSLFDLYDSQPIFNDNHAGRDDTWDDEFNDRSAQCYYTNDEQDDELDIETGWGETDGWGNTGETTPTIPENQRFKALLARDPLHCQKLSLVISASLNHTAELNGGMEAFHANYLVPPKVDANVLHEFEAWLTGAAKGGD